MLRFLCPLRIGDVHADAVDLHPLVGGDEDVAPPVDDAGLDHVAVLRRNGDLHLRRGDLELAAVDDVFRVQRHILTVLPAALLLKCLRLFLGYAAVGQHVAHLADGQRQHLGVAALLVLRNTLTQLLVDGVHHVVAALLLETILAILYSIVGYWAVNRTIYAHYVMVGDLGSIILRKWMVGLIAGPVCIPWAIIKLVTANKNG